MFSDEISSLKTYRTYEIDWEATEERFNIVNGVFLLAHALCELTIRDATPAVFHSLPWCSPTICIFPSQLFKPPSERWYLHNPQSDRDHQDCEGDRRCPEDPLICLHLTNVRCVHAEHAGHERKWQENDGYDCEHHCQHYRANLGH